MNDVVPLAEAVDDAIFGSKAVGLGQAAREGLPLPPGVALSGSIVEAVAAGEDVGHPAALGQAIWSLAKPVIAAVHGYCLGQACELAAVCDLTVATTSAKFGEVEIGLGWGPPLPITPFVLGLKRAKEVLLLGEIFDAELAMQIGLVNRVVSDDGLDAEVAGITERIAGLKPEAVAANKRLINSRYERAGFVPGAG